MKQSPPGRTITVKNSQRLVLPVEQLQPGMYVAEIDRPWEETTFLFQGFLLETEEDVRQVQAQCVTVTIDILSSVEIESRTKTGAKSKTHAVHKRLPVERALPKAQHTYTQTSTLVCSIFDDVRLGKTLDTPAAKQAVAECVDSVMDNPDALTLMTRIRDKDQYTAEHSMSVAVLSIALGRRLGMDREQLNRLGLCAMLHDVGKLMVPDPILNKPTELDAGEMQEMQRHTTYGRDILMSSSGLDDEGPDVAHAHHERLDGSGYPRGLDGTSLTPFTKMVAIIDTFDAMTSDRCYRLGQTNMSAFKVLTQGRGSKWDADLVFQFIETVGIYPPGSVAMLSSGEVVVVIESNPKLKLRPKVLMVKDPDDPGAQMHVIDLARTTHDRHGQRLYIAQMLHPKEAGIDLAAMRDTGILSDLGSELG